MTEVLRSFLFTPGNHARRVEKVFDAGADAAILDLEDAVAAAEKAATRPLIVQALQRPRRCKGYVRVNATDTEFCYQDLVSVVGAGLDGIILPKVESAAALQGIDWLLHQLERAAGLPPGEIDLIPIIETARGLCAANEIAQAGTRVKRLAFGAGDFTFDLNIVWSRDEIELLHARSTLVAASRAAGLQAPLDSVWIALDDEAGLQASSQAVQRMGFQGKMCIHPKQLAVVNAAFTPSEQEVAFARKVVAAFEAAESSGNAALQVEGRFIDYPIVYRAQRTLSSYAAATAKR